MRLGLGLGINRIILVSRPNPLYTLYLLTMLSQYVVSLYGAVECLLFDSLTLNKGINPCTGQNLFCINCRVSLNVLLNVLFIL